MPRIIQIMCELAPEETVLVRSAWLRNDIKASSLLAEARRRARDIAVQADDEAGRIHRHARSEGYAAGMLQAAGALAQYLDGHARLAAQLQSRLEEKVTLLLERCVNNPDVLMATFEEYLGEQEASARSCQDLCLDLLLPESFRGRHRSLLARVQQHFHGSVNIEYGEEARFLLRIGDHVAEFAIKDFITRASAIAMGSLPSIHAQSLALSDSCRQRIAAMFAPAEEGSRP